MTQGNILRQVFLFFAKYPLYQGVINNFVLASSASTEYVALKKLVEEMAEKSICPEIKDYVFGATDSAVKSKIDTLEDIYMFVDYGAVLSQLDELNRKTDAFDIAITVAHTNNGENNDTIEEVLIEDKMLDIITRIEKDMRARRGEDSFAHAIEYPVNIVPFYSADLHNSYGWTMIFKITGTDII